MQRTDESRDDGVWDDGEVVARVRAGDRDAFRLLVRRYQDPLYRYALRMTGSADVAADMVQAALVKAYTRLHRCRNPDRFGAWVFRILSNRCKDYLRNRRRRNVSLDDDGVNPAVLSSGADPVRDVERAELRTLLEQALARLPEHQREAFVLKHVEQRSYKEIAETLDVSVSALKMRVHRARETLRTMLEEVVE